MLQLHPGVSLSTLCDLFGKRRQSWYKSDDCRTKQQELNGQILSFIQEKRKEQSRLGTRKLQYLINTHPPFISAGVSMGRDTLFELLRANGMLVRKRKKRRLILTNGNGESIFPDLRKGLEVNRINHLWVCDITYIDLNTSDRHCYATFVVDEYSHLIVGYIVAMDMKASTTLLALQQAVQLHGPASGKFDHQLIFHSDRGSQFKSGLFNSFLQSQEIKSSICDKGKSSENPVSERLNDIIKNELMEEDSFDSFEQAKTAVDRAVHIYNTQRPHLSCEMLTPQQAHQKGSGTLKKLWTQRKKRTHENHA